MEQALLALALNIYAKHIPAVPPALLLAQVRQESGWNPKARSPVGAVGLTQFMPATLRWVASVNGLGNVDPYDPKDALTLQALYMRSLARGVTPVNSTCDRLLFALGDYNGGAGWRMKRQKRTATPGDYPSTSLINPGITAANQRENEQYPRRIYIGQSRYAKYGALECPTGTITPPSRGTAAPATPSRTL